MTAKLEDIKIGTIVNGLGPDGPVEVVAVEFHGTAATVVYRDRSSGQVGQQLVYRSDEDRLTLGESGQSWAFDADGELFRLAYLFDSLLAVHISNVEPLPHQIAAVYEEMLIRQPLRFLLADDPGAGKTIMAGLLIRELMLRGDLERCLIVCPANLAEQWQDEMRDKFQTVFNIIGRSDIEASASGNPFNDHDLIIGRIDLLKQNDNVERLNSVEWDLVVVDESHKMSAHYFGNEVKRTARYRLGEELGTKARHLLMMTATPHNGKDEDFNLSMGLLDPDRFEGRLRSGAPMLDPSDIMRRMLKEEMVDFEGHPLFPERRAYTVNYDLSDDEHALYRAVTSYVTEEMNRADQLGQGKDGDRRRTVVGFALTTLQRRLASSPAAIHESLKRRHRRLQLRLEEARKDKKDAEIREGRAEYIVEWSNPRVDRVDRVDIEDLEDDLEEQPEGEASEIVDLASAATTVAELEAEVEALARLEEMAESVRHSPFDRKWEQLSRVLEYPEMFDRGMRNKLVIFTEHKDTLDYLVDRIGVLVGRPAVRYIHGSLSRDHRANAQEAFLNDPDVKVLVATDAAGEGVNLQRAHLMVNYDLPWNPNRIEQRFGRIHRFLQREVCHLWNLVAHQTREGAVYQRLLEKLDDERSALGGKVFDVLGRAFTEISLRNLMIEAIRYNQSEDATQWMRQKIDATWDEAFLKNLVEERALNTTTINHEHLRSIKENMERAEARRLVPHFIEAFFVEAFQRLGGTVRQREPRRYEITRVPSELRRRPSLGRRVAVQPRYVRICFDKADRYVEGKPEAAFIAPGHPLLDAVADTLLDRYRELLKRGCVLIDDSDEEREPRVMFSVESEIVDGRLTRDGNRRIISRRVDYVELGENGQPVLAGTAPYLDYRVASDQEALAAASMAGWVSPALEDVANGFAIEYIAQQHYQEVRGEREELVRKTAAAVQDRLTREITYWDNRAEELKQQELAGRRPRLNSGNARRRAEDLESRLVNRMKELDAEMQMTAQPPRITGGCLVIPARTVASGSPPAASPASTKEVEAVAMAAVMSYEVAKGRVPRDVSKENRGWDIESADGTGKLRFIEVKGRRPDADTVAVSRNEWLTCMNKRGDYYLAIVFVDDGKSGGLHMIPDPIKGESTFGVTSVNLKIADLVNSSQTDAKGVVLA